MKEVTMFKCYLCSYMPRESHPGMKGEVTITLSPLDIKHITEALSEYNQKFYGPWEQKPNGQHWYKMTKANRQIGYIIRKLYLAAKDAFMKEKDDV